ncbi:MAG: hypothetical protein QXQ81_08410, partial [Candidatus Thorarchaeota archaeon]
MSTDQWTIERSKLVYGVDRSDLHFLDIDAAGRLILRIRGHTIPVVDIIETVNSNNVNRAAYTSSFTIRFPQLIESQIMKLRKAFADVMKEKDYRGAFRAVYPVKANQRADCVLAVLGSDKDYGLEVGTKTELFLAKIVTSNEKHRLIICNGAKDPEYLQLVLRCAELGHEVAVSIESLYEARLVTEMLPPGLVQIVLRLKPYLTVRGHWSHSGGRDSKFGLGIHDLFDVMSHLKERGYADSVSTILAHVGSQVTAFEDIRKFARFMFRAYTQVREEGFPLLTTIDFGGGLPIDYTSSNPSDLMDTYARAIVESVLEEHQSVSPGSEHPDIMIESGRGITALSSAILVKVLEVRSVFPPAGDVLDEELSRERENSVSRLRQAMSVNEIAETWTEFQTNRTCTGATLSEIRDSEQILNEVRAEARKQLARLATGSIWPDKTVESLWHPDYIAVGNFSVFNSILDHVLVNQYFPILPVTDLHVRPETTVRLVDITCDSDGEASLFYRKPADDLWFTRDYRPLTMPNGGIGVGIPVGNLRRLQGSYFLIALTGAYQDVIEADHNLLGDLP